MRAITPFVISAVVVTAPSMFGQIAPAPRSFPLLVLRVEGNKRIATDKILAATGLKIGRGVGKEAFDDARATLMKSGAFESIGYEFGPTEERTGYEGVFRVVEVAQLYPYRFEDLPASEEALRAALRKQETLLGDQIPATRQVLDRYEKAIDEFLANKVMVTGKLEIDAPGQMAIVFRPPNARPNVAEVHFMGNEVIDTTLLANTLAGVAVGVPYSETAIRTLLDSSIRSLYDARGRLRVAFPQITTARAAKGIDGVAVTVTVTEGPVFNLAGVKVTGVPSGKTGEVRDAGNWKSDGVANFDELNAGLDRASQRLRRDGYLHATGRIDRDVHDADHTVDVVVALDAGPQFTLGKLDIVGLDLLSEPAIRKMWGLKPGNPFDPGYPDAFLKRVRDEDMFDNLGKTRAETKLDESTHTVDVTLYFPGAAPQKKTIVPEREKIEAPNLP